MTTTLHDELDPYDSRPIRATAADGTALEGVFTQVDNWDYDVRMTKPFPRLSAGRHVPYFARSRDLYPPSYFDDHGTGLLRELYTAGCALEPHIDRLRAAWERLRIDLPDVEGAEADYRERRRHLRDARRTGHIDACTYDREFLAARDKRDRVQTDRDQVVARFFERNLSVPVSLSHQVLIEVLDHPEIPFRLPSS